MTTNPSEDDTARTGISGGHQDYVITAGSITGPVTFTTTGIRVPAYLQDPQRWARVESWDALTAGAHRARPDDAGGAVPTYVARDTDKELRARLTQAAQHGGLVLVLGESTAGKTRAAHHAVRECAALAGYRVLAPDTGPDLVIAVDVVATTMVRCVVWLDDLERFLTPDGLEAGVLAELVRLRTPVVATMQLRHYDTFSPHSTESHHENSASSLRTSGTGARVLKQTEPLYLQRRWSAEELTRAEDCDDTRIIDAVTHHGPYGVAEYLAAGPALLTEWRNANRPGGHPRGAALVAAAVDLARTGLRPPYPTSLLTALHQHYLTDDPLLRPEPLEAALAWAARLRYGATSLLLPTRAPDAWGVFDYLPDHSTSSVTEYAWQSALDHASDDEERFTIGVHAYATGAHIAEAAWRPLARNITAAAYNLGVLLAETGREAEAEGLFRQAAATGDTAAAANLGVLLAETGREAEAEEMYRQAAATGETGAAFNLGILLAKTGREAEAEEMYRQAAATGDTAAAFNLGILLAKTGREAEAEELFRQAAAIGDTDAAVNLGILLAKSERNEEAEELFRQAAATGDTDAAINLGILLAKTGREAEAEELFRQAAATGDTDAAINLGALLTKTGRIEEAEKLLRPAAATGNTDAAANLGILLAKTGREAEAEAMYRQAAATGHTAAAFNLGILLAETGREAEAEEMYRQAAATGHTAAAINLGILLAETGRETEAEAMFRQATATGDTDAAFNLGILLAKTGREAEAEEMYRQAAATGYTDAAINLGILLAETGREAEAEAMFRQAAATGDTDAAANLGILLAKTGREAEAEEMYHQAIDDGRLPIREPADAADLQGPFSSDN
ncbi:tetratricopeptide repeat protein [Streptomyces sp. A1547]|uniref:tetratricopeptide repeat protein n=1 Tax=Streptomyces sp. A1547 TaxID=2563105 RepID=UPI00109E5F5B|nr:tetratricopeptide repeat protein [Streptomyces sp. A1547]THA33689.1 tetratricopeptide repeat protein [Streptomyces sp. A1547]